MSPMRVAIIGAGPAGVYAADSLTKAVKDFSVSVDIFDRYPAPFGLIRYGVAPDHPRIKGIITALHKVMDRNDIRFLGNVQYGTDLTLDELRQHYHAIIFATGAIDDAELTIPGVNLPGSFGAADFVSWYDGHPDVSRQWPLEAREIAVIGNGNVALDVARILVKRPQDLLPTEIPAHVYEGLRNSSATDVHVFGRRGPAQVKFTPLELRELSKLNDVDIVLYPEDFDLNASDMAEIEANNQTKTMMKTLQNWLLNDEPTGASRRLHLHFLHKPIEIIGSNNNAVEGLRFERNKLMGQARVQGTGEIVEYQIQSVYRAIGYHGSSLPGVPYNAELGIIPHHRGRVLTEHNQPILGLYTTGWIKRGPVGLIGHTKSDALETITELLVDQPTLPAPLYPDENTIMQLLKTKGVRYTTWKGWLVLNEHEKALGENYQGEVTRERIKVASREEMIQISSFTQAQSQGNPSSSF